LEIVNTSVSSKNPLEIILFLVFYSVL